MYLQNNGDHSFFNFDYEEIWDPTSYENDSTLKKRNRMSRGIHYALTIS